MRVHKALWYICLGILVATPMWGATFGGRLTSSAYTWQTRELNGSDARHVRFYQTAILNANQLGGQPFSLHTHLQFSGDLADEVTGREHYRIYSAYAKWRRSGFDLRAGRQRIYAGVGYGTMDGVRAGLSPLGWLELTGYAGMLTPLVPDDGIGSWDEGHLWGGQALVEIQKTVVTASYAERARAPLAYLGAGRYTQVLINNPGTQFRRLGIDVRRDMGQASVYGRVDLDADVWEVQEIEVSGDVNVSSQFRLSAEFQYRKPTLHLNSILSVFEVQDNREARVSGTYRINEQTRLQGHVSRTYFDGDHSWDVGAGLLFGRNYIGYTRRMGYGGDNDAVTVAVQHPVNKLVTLRGDGAISSYRLYDGQVSRDRALSGTMGLRWQARPAVNIDLEAQVLHNAFYDRDARIFVRGSFWFFKRQP